MDSGDVIQLIMLLILIGFSAIFSSAETALMTCNRIRLRSMENEGNKKAGKVLDAAAMTYVAATLMAISQLIRLIAINNRDD